MCKHILNAQVSIRYYDGNWYDCPLCFLDENGTYPDLQRIGTEMVFACKQCKKCFRKDMTQFEEPDEYCPHCGNHYVVEAVTPETLREEACRDGADQRLRARLVDFGQEAIAVAVGLDKGVQGGRKTRVLRAGADEGEPGDAVGTHGVVLALRSLARGGADGDGPQLPACGLEHPERAVRRSV